MLELGILKQESIPYRINIIIWYTEAGIVLKTEKCIKIEVDKPHYCTSLQTLITMNVVLEADVIYEYQVMASHAGMQSMSR